MLNLMKALGISGDFQNKYRTDSEEFRKLTQWSFIELWKKGLIYMANRPNNYCVDCNNTIADAEIEYEELPTYLVTNRFKVRGIKQDLLVATTRPELLAACQMIIVHPGDPRYKKYVGKTAIIPIHNGEVPIRTHRSVDMKFGSGAVMVCSYGDYHDVMLFREFRLKEVVAIDLDGKMTEVTGKYVGMAVRDARSQIIQDLQEAGVAVIVDQIQHRTPLCERSRTPIEIIPMEEFYLKQLEFRPMLKSLARKIEFHPDMHRQILMNWINSLTTDYPISRRRYYATEIPIWYCTKCSTPPLERSRVPPRSVVLTRLRQMRGATLRAVPDRNLRRIVPPPRYWIVCRQTVDPVHKNLPVHIWIEFYLPGQALEHGAELELLQVELFHRYDFYRGTTAFTQRGSMLYLIDSDRDAGLLQVLNYLRPGVPHGHPHVLTGDFGHLTV